MKASKPNIAGLDEVVASLPAAERDLLRRIYEVTMTVGKMKIPPPMKPWVQARFGAEEDVTHQKIVRVTNKITGEEALFNRVRHFRPLEVTPDEELAEQLKEAANNDLFAQPLKTTPVDTFGRVAGRHCLTASNVAKYDSGHGLVIFNDFNPLQFTREHIIDYIDTAWKWAEEALTAEPAAKYFFLIWNCLWRAGASLAHGHAQVMLTQGRHYAKIEGLRRAAITYQENYGTSYFDDLFLAHQALGCAFDKNGVKVVANLTPFKDNGVVIFGPALNTSFKERLFEVLACFRDRLGIKSFNLGLTTPPLKETEESWAGFPVVAWLVDRGDPRSRASDIGGMEIFATSVVSSDPFELAAALRECL